MVVLKSVCSVPLFANVKKSARTARLISSFLNDFLVGSILELISYRKYLKIVYIKWG